METLQSKRRIITLYIRLWIHWSYWIITADNVSVENNEYWVPSQHKRENGV